MQAKSEPDAIGNLSGCQYGLGLGMGTGIRYWVIGNKHYSGTKCQGSGVGFQR